MTNEELEKELERTQKALGNTQQALMTLGDMVNKTRALLKAKGVIDDLDISYIKGELSAEEYKEKYREQNSLNNLFNQMFMSVYPTNDKEKNNEET